MDSYNSMKTKLLPLGIYSIGDNSNISAELKAYAEGLDVLFDTLDVMERECFISTAESYGIEERELFIGKERSEYSTEKRRNMLLIQEQMIDGKCNPDAFKKLLEGYGLSNFQIVEGFAEQTVTINVYDKLTDEIKKMIEENINANFPSHLIVTVNYL